MLRPTTFCRAIYSTKTCRCLKCGPKPVDALVPETPEELRREIQQLRKELARVTTQRDILKKTMSILSEV